MEYGTVTSTSILSGLVIYQERHYVSSFDVWMMACGILLILLGCALVGRRKTIKKKFDPGLIIANKYLPHAREQLARHTSKTPRPMGHIGGSTAPRRPNGAVRSPSDLPRARERSSAPLCSPPALLASTPPPTEGALRHQAEVV